MKNSREYNSTCKN